MSACLASEQSQELLASELMADVSRLHLGPEDRCKLSIQPLLDGVELLVWRGSFKQPLRLAVCDDSDRVHFTYVLHGKAHCELHRHCGCDTHEFGEGTGVVHFGPDRHGCFRQHGGYASVTVMVRPDVMATWAGDTDRSLQQEVAAGMCFQSGFRGAELHSTAMSLGCLVPPDINMSTRDAARNALWLRGQSLSMLGLFLEGLPAESAYRLSTADKTRLLRARDVLLSDLSRAPSLLELASLSGLSLVKLKRGFRALFDNSVYGLFMHERMHEARRRLLQGDVSVTEVAVDLGYTNVSHFAAAFRKHFAVSPAALKRDGLLASR